MNNPRIESLHVKNYRALQDLTLRDLTPLTVFLGANGSGKSTILDIFAFLSECFAEGVRRAWDRRNRFRELRSRGSTEPISFEIKYRETPNMPLITYHLSIDEDLKGPFVLQEWLSWRRKEYGKTVRFLDFQSGEGHVISGEYPDESEERVEERLSDRDVLAVNTLGQLAKHPRVKALRQFIMGWYLSYLTADNTRVLPQSGPAEHLSPSGDNLPNVIQYLHEQHPDLLESMLTRLSARVPRLERVEVESTIDGRLVLQIKDAPFDKPILSKFASDGTLKMLAYLTVLYDPSPPQWMGIEEPENHLHPRLLMGLAEECRRASSRSQLMVTTHAPYFVDGLKPKELWVLYRDKHGYTQAKRASDMPSINDLMNHGALLGNLWMEGYFEFGDPLTNQGGIK